MKTFRTIFWWTIVIGWLLAILWSVIEEQGFQTIAFCILAVMSWVGTGYFFGWYFGIKKHARRHLSASLQRVTELEHRPDQRDCQDIQRALSELFDEQSQRAKRLGLADAYGGLLNSLTVNSQVENLTWESHEIAPATWEELPNNAVYMLFNDGVPFIASLRHPTNHMHYDEEGESHQRSEALTLWVVGQTHQICRDAREMILKRSREASAMKGKTLVIRADRKGKPEVDFTTVDAVERSQIVLPKEIFAAVERTILQQMEAGDALRKAGQRTRTAILLFGPPGTGKTLLTRHLISQTEGYTTLLIQGFQRGVVREAFRLARYLEPALIVLEDVDLIAVKRQKNRGGTTALHALLDELDGMVPEARCGVIMTTNRPDVLEPALASRPGRVTQAIEFPIPTLEQRVELLTLFLSKTDATAVEIIAWANRTDGSSPAFLEELVRRAVLISINRDSSTSKTVVLDQDMKDAMQEIITLGGALTKRLLGHSKG